MGGTVLCVDDDRNLCRILAEALGEDGYRVRTAFDGEAALLAVAEEPPDLVLLDLILPRRDGFGVLEAIRGMAGPVAQVPVVIVSGCSPTPEYRDRAAALRVQELVTKPVPLDRLLDLAARCVGEHKRQVPAAEAGESESAERAPSGLSGSLEDMPIHALLHHLHGLRATGVLQLASGRKRKWVQLRDGRPYAVRSNLVNECLGNHLVRTGRISQAALAESRRRMKPGRLQGEILVAMDILSEDEIGGALRAQAEEKLLEIFGWRTGTYRFQGGVGLQRANVLGLEGSPANLILRGARERLPADVVEGFFKAHADCVVAHGESPFYQFQEVDLEPAYEELLRGLDGSRRLAEFSRAGSELKRTLYGLLAIGLLELPGGAPGARRQRAPQRPSRHPAAPLPPPDDEEKRAQLTATAERMAGQTLFEILGVDADASPHEMRAAYERLAEHLHPDHYSRSSSAVRQLAEEVFSRLTEAYETLGDPRRRSEYLLGRRREEREAARLEESRRALDAEKIFQHGQVLLSERAYERALQSFGKALELYPHEGEFHAHYGWTLHLCHPDDAQIAQEAIEHVKRSIRLAGHRETSYLFMGRLYKAIGRPGTAEKMFARAVQIQPDCVEALRELRLINMRREKSKGLIGRLLRR